MTTAAPKTDHLTCFDAACVDATLVGALGTLLLVLGLAWIFAAFAQR